MEETKENPLNHEMKYLFSYGSNNSKQIARRINQTEPILYTNGYIYNYTRIFAGTSEKWKGGIVGLYPCKNKKTYGTVIQLKEEQLLKLDTFEKGYKIVTMMVHNQLSDMLTEVIQAEVYWKENINFDYLPSNDYLCAIYQMLNERTGKHKENIIIRGVINDRLKEIAIWKPKYGIKMKL